MVVAVRRVICRFLFLAACALAPSLILTYPIMLSSNQSCFWAEVEVFASASSAANGLVRDVTSSLCYSTWYPLFTKVLPLYTDHPWYGMHLNFWTSWTLYVFLLNSHSAMAESKATTTTLNCPLLSILKPSGNPFASSPCYASSFHAPITAPFSSSSTSTAACGKLWLGDCSSLIAALHPSATAKPSEI